MSEEVKIKISQPMFEVGELERFDNNIHSIVEEYSKLMFKEKDQILTQRIIVKQEEEIERLKTELQDTKEHLGEYLHEQEEENKRLNNIINEIEDSIVGKINVLYQVRGQSNAIQELSILLRQLRELKGEDKE